MNVSVPKTIKVISFNEERILCSTGEEYIDVSIHNFQNICRFCLLGPAEMNLFRTEYKKHFIYNICKSQLSIMINLNDGLPTNICRKCENQIKDFINFRTSILKAEQILKNVLKNKNDCNYKTEITKETTDIVVGNVSDDSEDCLEARNDDCKSKTRRINFTCKYCNETFKKPIQYKQHLNEEREKRKDLFSSCTICKKLYNKRKLATHMKIHLKIKENQSFQCDMCGKNYRTKRNLSRHYLTHAGMPHECDVCGKGFREANLLKDHLNIHNGISPYLCNLCGKSYATSSAFRLHRAYTHNGNKRKNYKYPKKTENGPIKKAPKGSFPCEICGKVYSSRSTVNYHVLTHSEEKTFQCNDCGKMFANRSILDGKTLVENEDTANQEEGNLCNLEIDGSTCVENIEDTEHQEKEQFCNLEIGGSTCVENIEDTEHQEKKQFCNLEIGGSTCVENIEDTEHQEKKQFCNLGDHRRIHRLSYKCTFCERSFAYAASLETHINSHTGEKPHGCTVCDKRYSNRSHLKEHMRNHTGERPYSCSMCGKTFAVKGNLNAHIKTHAKNRTIP